MHDEFIIDNCYVDLVAGFWHSMNLIKFPDGQELLFEPQTGEFIDKNSVEIREIYLV